MKRLELKQILEKVSDLSRKYYRMYPTLYRDLLLWEDYLQCIEVRHRQKQRALKDKARMDILEAYNICDKTFYAILRRLRDLCEDV